MKNKYIILGPLWLISCQLMPPQNDRFEMVAWSEMEPLIKTGDSLLISKVEAYERNDVVGIVQKEVETDSMILIPARIVGLPGESIRMVDGKIFIDGQEYVDPPEVNFPYIMYAESIDSSFFEYHQIQRYYYAIGSFWHANLSHQQLAIIENEPQVGQVNLTLRNILGKDWVVGQTNENNWGKINWGPIRIPKVGDKVVLDEQNEALYSALFFEKKNKNLVKTECYFLLND
ncbi:MAG: S26 family signal peptidase, partial [Bacteroidota bacterium]